MTNDNVDFAFYTLKNGRVDPVALARVGVSDTLYADKAGNLYSKEAADLERVAPYTPYDTWECKMYRILEWNDTNTRSFNYSINKNLIENAAKNAAQAEESKDDMDFLTVHAKVISDEGLAKHLQLKHPQHSKQEPVYA